MPLAAGELLKKGNLRRCRIFASLEESDHISAEALCACFSGSALAVHPNVLSARASSQPPSISTLLNSLGRRMTFFVAHGRP